MLNKKIILQSLRCACPKCGTASIFPHRLTLTVKKTCPSCKLKLKNHDSGDGPAVFLVFILGFLLTPSALLLSAYTTIPLWGHAILWTCVALGICIFTMQPLKTFVIALNHKHRNGV
ncbi:MAG: hypothetical protein COB76_06805 [Alphaproteobacteria bacterium]|nr:MAG: hypothetical protein COB76_06805 [Alphaproteobacteria bacterium]